MNAGASRIERKLANRDTHSVGAEIAEAENALAIGHDDEPGAIRPIAEDFCDMSTIVGRDEQPARALEDQAVSLASQSNGWGVNQRLDFVDMVANHAEEQRFVAVVQRVQG